MSALAVPAPTGTFTLTAAIVMNNCNMYHTGNSLGVGLRNNANGYMSFADLSTYWASGGAVVEARHYTAFTASQAATSYGAAFNFVYIKITCDGAGNITFYYSQDGNFWVFLASETVASFLGGITHLIFCADPADNTTVGTNGNLLSWSVG